jgi:hypothetical protein
MGYHLYITRRSCLDDDSALEISKEEWLDIVEHDPDLEVFEGEGTFRGEVARMCLRDKAGTCTAARYFTYRDGDVGVKKPCEPVLKKMVEIADKIAARVIGERNEIYSKEGVPDRPTSFIAGGW